MDAHIQRPFWLKRIQSAQERRRLVWLNGVHRVGKTTLARMFPDADGANSVVLWGKRLAPLGWAGAEPHLYNATILTSDVKMVVLETGGAEVNRSIGRTANHPRLLKQ